MRVLLDGRMITDRMHGIARYVELLLDGLRRWGEAGDEFLVLTNEPRFLRRLTEGDGGARIFPVEVSPRLYTLSEQVLLPRIVSRSGVDLYHSTSYAAPRFLRAVPFVGTLFDFTHLTFYRSLRHELYFKLLVGPALRRSRKVITFSRIVREQAREILGLPVEKFHLSIIPPSPGFHPRPPEECRLVLEELEVRGRFILAVGNDRPHKNLPTMVEVHRLLRQKGHSDLTTVVVGMDRSSPPDGVRFVPHVDDETLAALYSRAEVVVFPSLSEGFGLPALEAMACGAAVVASGKTATREVVGDGGILVDTSSLEEVVRGVEKALAERDALSSRALERAALFSQRKMVEETLALYREVLGR